MSRSFLIGVLGLAVAAFALGAQRGGGGGGTHGGSGGGGGGGSGSSRGNGGGSGSGHPSYTNSSQNYGGNGGGWGHYNNNYPNNSGNSSQGYAPSGDDQPVYTPPANTTGAQPYQTNYVPSNTVPTQPDANSAPPANTAATPAPLAIPPTNSGFKTTLRIDATDAGDATNQLVGDDNSIATTIANNNAAEASAIVANTPAVPPADANAIVNAVQTGNPNALTPQVLGGLAGTPAGNALVTKAESVQLANNLAAQANAGTLTTQGVINGYTQLGNILAQGPGTAAQNAQTLAQAGQVFGQLSANSNAINALQTAQTGGGGSGVAAKGGGSKGGGGFPGWGGGGGGGGSDDGMPMGDDSTVFFVPGMPTGTVVPLGNNTAMVGTNLGDGSGQYSYGGAGITQGTGNVALAAGYPYGAALLVPGSTDQPATGTITLVNGATSAVNYKVNDNAYTMQPRYTQTLDAGATWVVAFDRGNNQGSAQYALAEGTYKFTVTNGGWELYQQTFSVALDNRDNRNDFNFLLNGKVEVVPAGQKRDFQGPNPLAIRFDNSAGQVRQKQLESGTYQVAIAADHSLDLFPPGSVTRPTGVPVPEPGAPAGSTGAVSVMHLPPGFKLFDPLASVRGKMKTFALPSQASLASAPAGSAGPAPAGHPPSGLKLFDASASARGKMKTFALPGQGSAASAPAASRSNAGLPGPVRRTSAMPTTDDGNSGM